jgi:hypothetical protein
MKHSLIVVIVVDKCSRSCLFVLSQDEDGDLVFITSSNHRQHEKRGVLAYKDNSRQEDEEGEGCGEEDEKEDKTQEQQDELRGLRFTYHRTAFDIDLDELDEHAWRLPHTDVSDYFNFGFNEPTWRVREGVRRLLGGFACLYMCNVICLFLLVVYMYVCSPIVPSSSSIDPAKVLVPAPLSPRAQ